MGINRNWGKGTPFSRMPEVPQATEARVRLARSLARKKGGMASTWAVVHIRGMGWEWKVRGSNPMEGDFGIEWYCHKSDAEI